MNLKVIQAINAMAETPEKIVGAFRIGNLYYFQYKNYVWSIAYSENADEYYLHFYRTDLPFEEVAGTNIDPSITYSTEDYNTQEVQQSFKALYQTVQSKALGLDDMFDDIIGDRTF